MNNGLNWGNIQRIDVDLVKSTRDFDIIQDFVNDFAFSRLNDKDVQIIKNPIVVKLISILQVSLKYVIDCQNELKNMNEKLQKSNLMQKEQIVLLKDEQNRKAALLRQAYQEYERCPVCGKKCSQMKSLDKHIYKDHRSHYESWVSLRKDTPIDHKKDIMILQTKIDELKQQLVKSTSAIRTVPTTVTFEDNKLERAAKLTSKQIQAEEPKPVPKSFFKQNMINIESLEDSVDDVFDTEKMSNNITKKVKSLEKSISKGLPTHFLTPEQTSHILNYNSMEYKRIKNQMREQLYQAIPLQKETECGSCSSAFTDTESI